MKKQIKTAFIAAFSLVIIIIAGTNDDGWAPGNYMESGMFGDLLPMWIGFFVGFLLSIGREER